MMDIVAIHREKEHAKIARMSIHRRRMKICALETVKENFNLEKAYVASALPTADVLYRRLDLPLKNRFAVQKALPFQIESTVPKEATVATRMEKIPSGTRVHLYAFRKEALERHIQELGEEPDFVTSVPVALEHFASHFLPPKEGLLLFHFGWEESHYLDIHGGGSRTIAFGLKTLLDTVPIKYLEEETLLQHISDKSVLRLSQEHQRMLDHFRPSSIAYTGYRDVARALLHKELEEVSLSRHAEFDLETIASYAVEIGIALSADNSVRLNPLSQKVKKNLLKEVGQVFAIAITSLLLSLSGLQLFSFQQKILFRQKYGGADPHFLEHQLGNILLLQKEKQTLEELFSLSSFGSYGPMKERLHFLENNKISLVKISEQETPQYRESHYRFHHPVEVAKEDVEKIFAIVEGEHPRAPQLIVKEYMIKPQGNGLYQMNMEIVQRVGYE